MDSFTARWDAQFSRLQAWLQQHPRKFPVQGALDSIEAGLARWANKQRVAYAEGVLSSDRATRLRQLPCWSWHAFDEQFESSLADLRRFVTQSGGVYPIQLAENSAERRLACFMNHRREEYAKGVLNSDRATRLQQLPCWSWHAFDEQFESSLADLRRFVTQSGGVYPIQLAENGAERRLACFMNHRREEYAEGVLNSDRAARLQQLPCWSWHAFDEQFESSLADVTQFVMQSGGVYPKQHAENSTERRLARFMNHRREDYASGVLPVSRIQALDRLPNWSWNVPVSAWEASLSALKKYLKDHSGTYPDRDAADELTRKHATLVHHRRCEHAAGTLSRSRAEELESLPGWSWNARETRWQEWFQAAEEWFYILPWSRDDPRPEYPSHRRDARKRKSFSAFEGGEITSTDSESDESYVMPISQSDGQDTSYGLHESRLARWLMRQKSVCADGNLDKIHAQELTQLPNWLWHVQPGVVQPDNV